MASVQGMPLQSSGSPTMGSAYGTYQAPVTSMVNARGTYQAPGQSTAATYVAPGSSSPAINGANLIPSNLDTAGRIGVPAPVAPAGPSQSDLAQQWIQQMLGQAYPGGGGPNLSGFDSLLADVAAREEALGGRKAEQEAFIDGIINASRTRDEANKAGVQGRYEGLLDTASTQRTAEINAIQNAELERLAQRNAAREALGVAGGADLTSAESESAGATVSSLGDVASRDALIQQSIEEQQYANQLAGLDPMQLLAQTQLSNTYEDRLAQLASERAGYQQQRASAASSYSPGGPSIGELLALQDAASQMFGPGEMPEIPGLGGITQQYSPYTNKAQQVADAAASFLSSPAIQNTILAGGKLDKATIVSQIVNSYPEVFAGDSFATSQLADIVDYLTQ